MGTSFEQRHHFSEASRYEVVLAPHTEVLRHPYRCRCRCRWDPQVAQMAHGLRLVPGLALKLGLSLGLARVLALGLVLAQGLGLALALGPVGHLDKQFTKEAPSASTSANSDRSADRHFPAQSSVVG